MRKTELTVSGEVIHPKTKASIVSHEHTNVESYLNQQNRTSSVITQSSATSQVGLGDEVDLSFCVEDGFYESATLYGRTLVNCIQEPSSQDVILPYEFTEGQYVTINDTKESGALGVELKGRTLVNEALVDYMTFGSGASINDGRVTLDLSKQYSRVEISRQNPLIAPNQTYTCVLYDVVGDVTNVSFTVQNASSTKMHLKNVGYKFKFIMGVGNDSTNRYCYVENLVATSGTLSFKMVLLKGDYTNVDAPYFTGVASVKAPTVKTVGKNLFNITNVECINNSFTLNKFNSSNYFVTDTLVEEGKQYTLSLNANIGGSSGNWFCLGYMSDKSHSNKISHTITVIEENINKSLTVTFTARRTDYVKLVILTSKNGYTAVLSNIQLEESTQATTYEPHKSSSLTLPKEVVLRSLPNGVCDTYNTRTGEYVQRVGEIVLNGSDIITSSIDFNLLEVLTNTSRCYIGFHTMASKVNMKPYSDSVTTTPQLICDSLPVKEVIPSLTSTDSECVGQTNSGFSIRLRGKSIEECRNRLSQNPVTIQYELKTPIITKMIPQSTLKSWDTTTHIYSEIPENSLYPILSHLNPTYPVILKPSTKYSIVANSYNNSHTNPTISFNLGGATASITAGNRVVTITTPSTLSNELLTMSGRGNKLNNVMVIEGDIVGDEPYFEGICDCKSPILANVGKNLFDGKIKRGIALGGSGLEVGNRDRASSDFIKVKPSTSYRLSGINIKAILAFDDKKIVVGNMGITGEIITPANTEYIRFTCVNEDILNAMLVENSFQATYEPHKSNVLSCNGDKINLTEDMFEQGTTGEFSANIGATYHSFKSDSNHRIRTKEIIKIKPNTTYSVICNDGYTTRIAGFDINGLCLSEIKSFSSNTTIITTSNNVHYICVVLSKVSGSISMSNFSQSGLEIREVDKAIVLRSLPNGVRDMLNVKTGEHVQRVGEVMLDGSEGESWSMPTNFSNGDCKGYSLNVDNLTSILICDSLNVLPNSQKYTTKEGVFASKGSIIIKKNLATRELLKEWLSQNPITVQYELETPIVSTVNVQGFPYAYKDGHIQLSSGHSEQSLTPKLEYVVQTNRTGAIQANQDRLINHEKRLMTLETMILHQLIQLEYRRAKSVFLSQTRQIFEGGIRMYHTKYDLLLEFIEKKLYRSLEEVLEMLDVYFMLGDLTDGEYDALYSVLFPMNEIDATEGEACDDSLETM